MPKPLVVITRNVPQSTLDLLKPHFQIDYYNQPLPIPRKDLLRRIKKATGLLCMLTDKTNSELFNAGPQLKIVATYSVGFDHVDVPEASRRGVLITNTPGVLTETTADLTWALLLSAARRIVEGDRMMRAGRYKGWNPLMLLGTDIHGKTLGIVGFGRIGQAVARRAKGFGMRVLYSDVQQVFPETESQLGAHYAGLEELLRESDFITLHPALDPSTHHLINEKRLKQMKPAAYIINAARGPIIDENALVKALKSGWIRGAALDVYEQEPKTAPGLTKLSNVVLVPHLGSASLETREAMGRLAASSIVDYLVHGRIPANCANPNQFKPVLS